MENDKDLLRVQLEQMKTQTNVKEEKCNQIEVTEILNLIVYKSTNFAPIAAITKSSERLWGVVRATPDPARSCRRIIE